MHTLQAASCGIPCRFSADGKLISVGLGLVGALSQPVCCVPLRRYAAAAKVKVDGPPRPVRSGKKKPESKPAGCAYALSAGGEISPRDWQWQYGIWLGGTAGASKLEKASVCSTPRLYLRRLASSLPVPWPGGRPANSSVCFFATTRQQCWSAQNRVMPSDGPLGPPKNWTLALSAPDSQVCRRRWPGTLLPSWQSGIGRASL